MEMKEIGFGTWNLRGKDCISAVKNAISIGYRHIDTAQMYGNEREVGEGIKLSNVKREELFITTKLCYPNVTYDMVIEGVKTSLKKLGTNYIDLVLIHEPYSTTQEMYSALEYLVSQGIVKNIGVSNFNKNQIDKLLASCKILPYCNQIENHLFYQRRKYVEYLQDKGIKVVAWSPLCADISKINCEETVLQIANFHSKSPAQIALKFLLQRKIYIIPKTKNVNRMRENLNLYDFELSKLEMEKLYSLDKNKSLFGWYE